MNLLLLPAFASLSATVSLPPCDSSHLPPALEQCLAARKRIRRADVWWAGGSRASRALPGAMFGRRMLIAGDDIAQFDYGDARGITGTDADGRPVSMRTRELFSRELMVHYREGDPVALAERHSRKQPFFSDVRAFGLLPDRHPDYRPLPEVLCAYPFDDPSGRKYSQRREGDFYVVTLRTKRGTEVRWTIDPRRDWNVVRAERYDNGVLTKYSVSHLERFGEVWFPGQIDFYLGSSRDPVSRLAIRAARLNDPDLPDRLTPAALELEPGITFNIAIPGRQRPEVRVWTGQELIDAREWAEMERRGEVTPGPTVLAFREKARRAMESSRTSDGSRPASGTDEPQSPRATRGRPDHLPASGPADPWYRYTVRFIEHYRLDPQQRQRALAIYRECRQLADARLAQLRPRIRSVQQRLTGAAERGDSAALSRLRGELRDVLAPIDRIFQMRLKPRLDRLPTRAQRRAAGPMPEKAWPTPAVEP